jgi:hypothetical protein
MAATVAHARPAQSSETGDRMLGVPPCRPRSCPIHAGAGPLTEHCGQVEDALAEYEAIEVAWRRAGRGGRSRQRSAESRRSQGAG